MNAPPLLVDDETPEPHGERRVSDGRRRDDAAVHEILSELKKLNEQPPSMSLTRLAALVVAGSTIVGAIIAGIIWLGGGVVGPGARFDEFRRAQMKADSAAAKERALVLQALGATNSTLARYGYDMCTSVHKRPERECFEGYVVQARTAMPLVVPDP